MLDGWSRRTKSFVARGRFAQAVMISFILGLADGASHSARRAEIDACG